MTRKDISPWRWGGLRRWESESDRPFEGFTTRMETLHRQIDQLFEDLWRGPLRHGFRNDIGSRFEFRPSVDETEDEKAYHISIDLPGMDEGDVDVMVTDHSLTIRGDKKEEDEQKGKDFYRRERSYGAFKRVIELPTEVDQSKIDAKFKKGVLRITLPKTKEALEKVRHVPVKVA